MTTVSVELQNELDQLTLGELQDLVAQKTGIAEPDDRTKNFLWIAIPIFLGVITLVAMILAIIQFNKTDGKGAEFFGGIATLCLGAIIGILVPSPTTAPEK